MENDASKNTIKKNGMRILLVEDNPVNQIIVSGILLQWGVSITSAENGIEAIDFIEKDSFDLVLMDIQMPKLDGVAAAKVIRRNLKDKTPIVAMTAYVTDEEKQRCLEAGMNEFISKPVDRDLLFSLLEKYQNNSEKQVEKVVLQAVSNQKDIILDGIELYDALSRLNCDTTEFSEILQNFCEFYSDVENKLKKILEAGETDELKREAHSIKGAAVNISAINLYLAAKEFEEVLKSDDKDSYETNIESLVSKFNEVFHSNSLLKKQISRELA